MMKSREKPLTGVTQPEVVALALYLLGGAETAVDTEDVAVRVQELAPGRFSWRKYPDQINLELVRVALSDARKPESGALVNGTGRRGWSLTVAGQRWAEGNVDRLQDVDFSRQRQERRAGSIDERRWQRERARVLTTEAWRQWSTSGDPTAITRADATDLFRIDRYVVGRARDMKVNRLRAMFSADEDLAPFLEAASAVALEEE